MSGRLKVGDHWRCMTGGASFDMRADARKLRMRVGGAWHRQKLLMPRTHHPHPELGAKRHVEGRTLFVQHGCATTCRLALVLLLLMAAPAARAGSFVAGTEDVPLMPGLAPVAGSALAFDKPEGRIVEAQASGKVTRAAVHQFYAGTLPQLGWTAAGAETWRRERETLRLDFNGRDGDLTVGFTLSPR
jgi:hypothetical protein